MYSKIETAIVERLALGLGKMAVTVTSYGGQLDNDFEQVGRTMPAVWVTFAGVTKTQAHNVARDKYAVFARFAVIAADYNIRSEVSTRQGGVNLNEVGTYRLISGIRRLLTNQDMGLPIDELKPGAIRTLFNTNINNKAVSVFACEFDTYWIEGRLDNGSWPAPIDESDPDYVFAQYKGKLDIPSVDVAAITADYQINEKSVVVDEITKPAQVDDNQESNDNEEDNRQGA